MIRSRFYTIMIVPDARSSIRTFLVNRITVCVALLLVLGSAIGAGLLVKEHLAARSEIASMKEQVAKMKEAVLTSEQARQLVQDMQNLKNRISDVGEKAGRIETMVGLDGELAVGGPDTGRRSGAFSRFYKGEQKALLDELSVEMGMLDATLDEQDVRAEALLSYLGRHRKLLNSMPSITPIEGGWMSSAFGTRLDPFTHKRTFHHGVDIACPKGTPIHATADGIVTKVKWCSGWGHAIEIDHGNGFSTWYAHCHKIIAQRGDHLKRGDVIALVGSTGRSTGPHLHYEVRINGKPQNPAQYMLDRG
ncbi:M23 family metallopeptidase [bacterium]|nr:M23 family metallopeptidase [bacterium]